MIRRPWLLLAALVAGLGVVVAIWTSIDRRPPEWDYANHLERALQCYRILAQPGTTGPARSSRRPRSIRS